jgi:hypothetical protein
LNPIITKKHFNQKELPSLNSLYLLSPLMVDKLNLYKYFDKKKTFINYPATEYPIYKFSSKLNLNWSLFTIWGD